MKTIYILLTRPQTFVSNLVHLVTADPYTHVSISFDEDLQPLYSSARKNGRTMFPAGPCRELFSRGLYKTYPQTPCAVYTLRVSDEVYEKAREEVQKIISRADSYKFNTFGMFTCYMNIPYHPKHRYFCSQFVSDVLSRSKALKIPKDSSLMRPMDYSKFPQLSCIYRGCIGEFCSKRITKTYRIELPAK